VFVPLLHPHRRVTPRHAQDRDFAGTLYTDGGDGGDVGLKAVARNGRRNYQVSVLEVLDENTPDDTIEQIESHWKNKLLSRQFGLNRN
jgi:hypothetical protein